MKEISDALDGFEQDTGIDIPVHVDGASGAMIAPFRAPGRFAFTLKDDVENYTVFDVSNALRERGWQVPAYTFPEKRTDLAALRVVVRRGFTHDLADMLVADIERQLPRLQKQPAPVNDAASGTAFAH